jgi:glycosyltransferase involved in cell wall biosynthesis
MLQGILSFVRRGPRRPVAERQGLRVLALGPFFSENWVAAHLEALAGCERVEQVDVIVPTSYRPIPGLNYVVFMPGVARLLGDGWARVLAAVQQIGRQRPDIVIGYHLPWNGLMSLLLARATGVRALYFSVGGPAEFIGGGCYSEHALFTRIGRESPSLERRFVRLIGAFDAVLTMGSRSRATFESLGIPCPVEPISVGVSGEKFLHADDRAQGTPRYDLVTVGRLARIKRVDLLLRAVATLEPNQRPRVAVVGDGSEADALAAQARELKVEQWIQFLGWREDVEAILRESRAFVMSSASEGLPLALIEAMLSGLPAVVPDVGDIPDLVADGETGVLFPAGDVAQLAVAITRVLADEQARRRMAVRSVSAARRFTVESRAGDWLRFFGRLLPEGREKDGEPDRAGTRPEDHEPSQDAGSGVGR